MAHGAQDSVLTGAAGDVPGPRVWSQSDASRMAVGPAVQRAAWHTAFHAPRSLRLAPMPCMSAMQLPGPADVPRPATRSGTPSARAHHHGDVVNRVSCTHGGSPFVPADLRPGPHQKDGGPSTTPTASRRCTPDGPGRKPEPVSGTLRQARWPAPAGPPSRHRPRCRLGPFATIPARELYTVLRCRLAARCPSRPRNGRPPPEHPRSQQRTRATRHVAAEHPLPAAHERQAKPADVTITLRRTRGRLRTWCGR
jgi:hypothetical protein